MRSEESLSDTDPEPIDRRKFIEIWKVFEKKSNVADRLSGSTEVQPANLPTSNRKPFTKFNKELRAVLIQKE